MYPVHGGSDIVSINPDCPGENILAVFSQIKAWLPDSGSEEQVLISIGADYYPNETVRASDLTGVNYLPGAYGGVINSLRRRRNIFLQRMLLTLMF